MVDQLVLVVGVFVVIALVAVGMSMRQRGASKPYRFRVMTGAHGSGHQGTTFMSPLKWKPEAGEFLCRFVIDGNPIWGVPDTGSANIVALERDITPRESAEVGEPRTLRYGTATVEAKWYKGNVNEHKGIIYASGKEKITGGGTGTMVNIFGMTLSFGDRDHATIQQLNDPVVTFDFRADSNADGHIMLGSREYMGSHNQSEPLLPYRSLSQLVGRGGPGVLWNVCICKSLKDSQGKELLRDTSKPFYVMFDTGTTFGLLPDWLLNKVGQDGGDKVTFAFQSGSKLTLQAGRSSGGPLLGQDSMVVGNQWLKDKVMSWDFQTLKMHW